MGRNQNRKLRRQPLNPPAEETTDVREAPQLRSQADEVATTPQPRRPRRTFPTGAPLAGSEILLAVGSRGTVGRAMHDVIHTPDDERVSTRLGPEQVASVAFRSDRALGDAGAEFAEDFGRDFLMAATTGEDIGEIESAAAAEASELGEPFLHVTDELEDLTDYAQPVDDDAPPPRSAKR